MTYQELLNNQLKTGNSETACEFNAAIEFANQPEIDVTDSKPESTFNRVIKNLVGNNGNA